MPLIVDPNKDVSNGVGSTFKLITIFLSVGLPILTILITILWGINYGFNKFI